MWETVKYLSDADLIGAIRAVETTPIWHLPGYDAENAAVNREILNYLAELKREQLKRPTTRTFS